MSRLLAPALATFLAVLLLALPATAHAEATVDSSTIQSDYPKQLIFKLTAHADGDITGVKLNYALAGRSIRAVAFPEPFAPSASVSVEVPIDVNISNRFIPVGSEFAYQWEITMADGSVSITDEEIYTHLPPGKDWQSVEDETLRIYYYGSNEDEARAYLAAADDTYERIGRGLLQTELPHLPVVIVVFPTRDELVEAQNQPSETLCGSKFSDHTVMHVLGGSCGSTSVEDVVRHEFAHMLNEAAGNSALARIPSWLDEGTAVYAESSPGDFGRAYEAARRQNRLVPLARLDPVLRDRDAGLFYGQSWAMAKFLIDDQGQEKFAELFATVKDGNRFDQAFQRVYGFDLATFEQRFFQAAGAQQQPTPTATPAAQQSAPTTVPTQAAAQNTPASGSGDSGPSSTTLAIFGAAVLMALLAVLAFLVSLMLQNNRRQSAGQHLPRTEPDTPSPPEEPPAAE